MSHEKSLSRRTFISTALGIAGGFIAGVVAGWSVKPSEIRPVQTVTVPPVTITKTEIKEIRPELKPIKLGSAHPLTGWDAPSGREMHRGIEMAVEEINEQGGILGSKIDWVELDSEDMSAEKMVSVMTTLATSARVDWVIYGYSATYAPVYRTLAQYNVPFMHVDTASEFEDWIKNNPDKKYLGWMADPPEIYYGSGFAIFIDQLIEKKIWTPRNKKLAIIRGEDVYAQRIAEAFINEMKERGWYVILDETVTFETVEFRPYLIKIRREEPDVIFNTDWSVTGFANFMRQFFEEPTRSWIYGQWAPSVPEFKELAGEAANGLIWSTVIGYLPPDKDPVSNMWYKKYKAKYGEEPGHMAAINYDMVWLWATAAKLAESTDPKKMEPVLLKILYRGVCGVYNFNENHWAVGYPDIVKDPSLGLPHLHFQIKKGKDVLISPWPYATEEVELPPWF